jgi:deoxyribonuclease-4
VTLSARGAGVRFIGAHTIDTGGIHMAVKRAASARMTALQIFTAIPKYYGDRVSIKSERVARFRAALDEAGIAPVRVMVHAAYVLNTATPDPAKWLRARDGLARELERSTALGAGAVCFHPGAATDDDREAALDRIAAAILYALERTDGATRLLVENTAGAGRTMGRTPAEVAGILQRVPKALRARTGYGLDTCHLFSSGFAIHESAAAQAKVLDDFEAATEERPGFFHLNDSEGTLGSNKDRHQLIGEGRIGAEPFRWLLRDERSAGVPLILETPQRNPDIAADDSAADPWDARMVELLRGFE